MKFTFNYQDWAHAEWNVIIPEYKAKYTLENFRKEKESDWPSNVGVGFWHLTRGIITGGRYRQSPDTASRLSRL
jgi:hypothetical protein